MTKSDCSIHHHLQKKNLNACGSLRSAAAPTLINSKMNHVANLFKTKSFQNFSILVL